MIQLAHSDEYNLDKEVNITMTIADLAIIHALIAVSTDEDAMEAIGGSRGRVFSDESMVAELSSEVDLLTMYRATTSILEREGVKLV